MKDINMLFGDAREVLDSLNIEYGNILAINVNSRAKSRWGRCYSKGNNNYVLEISERLLQDDVYWEAAMNTMIHELLHAHKDRMCHTGEWKRCANLVNKYYPQYNIKRCTSSEEKGIKEERHATRRESYKYEITCDGCGYVDKYKRMSPVVKLILANPKNSGCRCTLCKCTSFTVRTLQNFSL